MITPLTILGYVKAEPFRPFRIHMVSGRTFDVRHPEMAKVLKSVVLIFSSASETSKFPDHFESVSLMLAESLAHLDSSVETEISAR